MGREKRTSKDLTKANTRMSSVKSIDANFNLGNGVTKATYQAAIDDTGLKLDDYNTKLSDVDDALDALEASEKTLRDFSQRVLSGVGSKYGYDSNEYEQAGGTRKSEKKKKVSKPKTT